MPPKTQKRKKKINKNFRKRTKRIFVRNLIREVAGFSPYEKRAIEMLKLGYEKRALRFCKRRLGTQKRARKKRDELAKIVQQMKTQSLEK
ncbi:60S ribosomal protein L36 [Anaeramoeba flamelloides]|uniref:60S ribosomal protein L36 n=1 Tax=Anaeramoeba flamelloides TaxID=1746091 RepID=A0AAV8AFK8_9EUKA|nr:60S ribosomal protein L36 [Anaeramoeba flamelloides]KAJ3425795.1 60S ribosomal protein L36 [Anaeramoeba flamelloides]KAJ3425912.1 60S ribosomal protein L36 [Anaeramoeba flamelloides]KAJ3427933.1 60S ribosomal protein L36 [Anaeramoeba flamelloides]KAJ3428012.1 60S ribosomal protein L36 [Anaeramoeba flamelloides]